MPFKKRSPQKSAFLFLLILFFVIFIFPGFFHGLRLRMGEAIVVPSGWMAGPVFELKKFLIYRKTHDDYQKLKKEYDFLKARLSGAEQTEQENRRLKSLLDLDQRINRPTIAAFVTGRDFSAWESSVTLDRGRKDGVKKGDAVVTYSGVVGRIADVSDHTSRMVFLTDPQFSVAGHLQDGRQGVLVSGALGGQCRIRYVEYPERVQIGDSVFTSQMSDIFPQNLLIGTVVSPKPGSNGETEFLLKPSVPLSDLREVLVIPSGTQHD